jgi:hypothetical protein
MIQRHAGGHALEKQFKPPSPTPISKLILLILLQAIKFAKSGNYPLKLPKLM